MDAGLAFGPGPSGALRGRRAASYRVWGLPRSWLRWKPSVPGVSREDPPGLFLLCCRWPSPRGGPGSPSPCHSGKEPWPCPSEPLTSVAMAMRSPSGLGSSTSADPQD